MKRNAELTKKKIITKSLKIFQKKGFNGTSMSDISKATGFTNSLILYHFKNKEGIYKEVQKKATLDYYNYQKKQNIPMGNNIETLTSIVKTAFNYFTTANEYYNLSLWDYLEDNDSIGKTEVDFSMGLIPLLNKILERKSNKIDSFIIYTMVMGSIQNWIRYKDYYQKSKEDYLSNLIESIEELLS